MVIAMMWQGCGLGDKEIITWGEIFWICGFKSSGILYVQYLFTWSTNKTYGLLGIK